MKPYVIVKLGSSQHKVSVGDLLITDRLDKEPGDTHTVSEVLLYSDGDTTKVGTPTLDIPVVFEVVENKKGVKVKIHKFKAKSHYQKTTGYRAFLTKLKVTSIDGDSEVKETKKEVKASTEAKVTKTKSVKAKVKTK